MLRKTQSGTKLSRIIWGVGIGALLSVLLMSVITNIVSASPSELDSRDSLPVVPALQSMATPTATLQIKNTSVYSFSLAGLGYDEVTLNSPSGTAEYSFRLPETWSITDGELNLDFSYVFNRTDIEGSPVQFGDLTVKLDSQTLRVFTIDEEILDNYQLRVPLPLALLDNPDKTQHDIELILDAGFLCEVPHKAKLVIHPTSFIVLNYGQRPLVLDLNRYPLPFYQRAFEPDLIRFVLPAQPTTDDVGHAVSIAAKLGDLTDNGVVISATTDLDLNHPSTSPPILDEHLIVIGQPQDNQFLMFLNDTVDLPVSLHQRQLGLVTQGPTSVAPDGTYTYLFTITNTVDRVVNLSAINSLSAYAKLVNCVPDCIENNDDNTIIWNNSSLAPNETLKLSLTFKVADTRTGIAIENTITVVEADLGPVNADTLASTVVTDTTGIEPQISVAGEEDYFFMYNGRAVAREDGVVQEVLSPWREDRAVLIITGLSNEAVKKAAQAMSSAARFPGMSGVVALVRDVLPPSVVADPTTTGERTFADLGYSSNRVVPGGGEPKQIDYYFQVPYGWQLTNDAFLELYFSHSQLLDYEDSGLTVLLNKQPLISIAFSEETADDGQARVNLADAYKYGSNRLTLKVDASMPGTCVDSDQAWTLIKSSSKIFLAHDEETGLDFDFDIYPYPFYLNPALTDLLFVLPDTPTNDELEHVLRLAAALGNSAAGKTILPTVIMGSDLPPQTLADYQIIALGRPSRNTLIQQANSQLPQPFLPGSDQIDQQLDDVTFRLPSDLTLGYLQLIPSPWNEKRALLVVTGTTDESVDWAADVLANRAGTLRKGNLALIRDDNEVKTIDTRTLISGGAVVAVATAVSETTPLAEMDLEGTPVVETEVTFTPSLPANSTPNISALEQAPGGTNRPAWLIPLVAIAVLIVIVIFVVAFWQSRKSGR